MAKYKIGDKVICKNHPEYGTGAIIVDYGDESYFVRFCACAVILYAQELDIFNGFQTGDAVINIAHPQWGTGIICEKFSSDIYIVIFPKNFSLTPFQCNVFELTTFSTKMPDIVNYTYNATTAVTTIEWSDGTKTTARAEDPSTANSYTGFVTAYAKKAAGNNNTINKLYDEWAVEKPAREAKAQIKANAAALEEQRIAKKRKAKKEQYLIRKRAAEINKEYEAKKLAHEKYGVPMDYKAGDSD